MNQTTPTTYVFGDNDGRAGIACISGDAGGFDCLNAPLTQRQMLANIRAVIAADDWLDERAASVLLANVDWCADKLHAEHVARFTARKA